MLYLLPILLFVVSFGDENCNSITFTDSTGRLWGTPTGNIYRYTCDNIYLIIMI